MKPSTEQFALRVMSGEARGLSVSLLRAAMLLAEAPYRAATRTRNVLFDAGVLRAQRLSRPVISVGNITTGGTGKTPMVLWLARQLVHGGHRPAILMRGYRGNSSAGGSDEAALLDESLNCVGGVSRARVPIQIGADRVATGTSAIAVHPELDALVLDDGFQHRGLARDFDLVLIDATHPFGYGHVLPRGLLRESLRGLRRADAVVITRCDQVPEPALTAIESALLTYNDGAPIYRARHALRMLLGPRNESRPIEELRGRRILAFCGIGNPRSFYQQFVDHGAVNAGARSFADHHDYSAADVSELRSAARAAGAEMLVTTEKDWIKLRRFSQATSTDEPTIHRAALEIEFAGDDARRLFGLISNRIWPGRV